MTETHLVDITPEMTVNAIITRHPHTLPVFKRHGIDSCCGGALSIWDVAKKHKLDLVKLLSELEEA